MTLTFLLPTHIKVAAAMSSDIYDYSPHLLAIQAMVKQLTEATLKKDWDRAEILSMKIAVEAKLLLNWLKDQK